MFFSYAVRYNPYRRSRAVYIIWVAKCNLINKLG